MTDSLWHSLAEARQRGFRQSRIALQQLIRRSFESHKGRRIDAVGEVETHRTNRRLISHTEADRMNAVIKVLIVPLREAQRNVAQRAVHVPHIVERNALNVVADEWKSELDIVKKKCIASQWKSRR